MKLISDVIENPNLKENQKAQYKQEKKQ